jgi:hypothetical protein
MGKTLDKINFPHQLGNFSLLQALQPNTLDGDHLACVQIESAIDGAELSTSDAVSQLLFKMSAITKRNAQSQVD